MDTESKEIVVEITAEEIMYMSHNFLGQTIINKLKAAGIPIIGILLFQGVSSGTLIQERNFVNDSYIFRWKE